MGLSSVRTLLGNAVPLTRMKKVPTAGGEAAAPLLLAERAVSETQRLEATILDTLAEVQFGLGMDAAAISAIDEAIALDPNETYYHEQRRRFAGERARGDRPEYIPPMFREPNEIGPPAETELGEPDLRV